MAQDIIIKIGDNEYKLSAQTPEAEEVMRLAAKMVRHHIEAFQKKYPGKQMVDILSFVALNLSMDLIRGNRRSSAIENEAIDLHKVLDDYIKNIEK